MSRDYPTVKILVDGPTKDGDINVRSNVRGFVEITMKDGTSSVVRADALLLAVEAASLLTLSEV